MAWNKRDWVAFAVMMVIVIAANTAFGFLRNWLVAYMHWPVWSQAVITIVVAVIGAAIVLMIARRRRKA
jgi:hypothetical protein